MPLTPFADGPGNTASGLAVYNNDLYLEALANAKEAAFSTWKTIETRSGYLLNQGASSFALNFGLTMPLFTATAGAGPFAFYLDPADYVAGTRTTQMRIRFTLMTNGVASGTTYAAGMASVASIGGNSGFQPGITSLATVSGAAVSFTTPAVNSRTTVLSSVFTAPAADLYVMYASIGGNQAAGSAVGIIGQLQMRQV